MDRLVTVIGGSGFLGRYIVPALLKRGDRVRIACRDPREAWYLKPQGDLGQTQFVACDVTRPESVARAVKGSDAVVNLVGILKGDFARVQAEGARNVAVAAAEAGVAALVHVSAIGADRANASRYGRTKAEGEAAVRAAFASATILRPSLVFGREDGFINRFAALIRMAPVMPVVKGALKLQPVYVGDVAAAVAAALDDPAAHGGKTYELGGPQVMTMAGLYRWIAEQIGHKPVFVDMPDAAAGALASLTGWLPGAPITRDQWLMLQADNVVAEGAVGLGELGITPTPLAAAAPGWLVQYRKHGRFAAKASA